MAENSLIVGQIRWRDSSPPSSVIVRAFDRDLRSEQLLGEATTDAEGRYQIAYQPVQFRRAEKERADLIVRIVSPEGIQLAESEILWNAPERAVIDLVVVPATDRQLSEFERYVRQLARLLENQGLPEGQELAHLTAEDIRFLTGETGIDRQHLEFLHQAAQLSQQSGLLAEVHYGWVRQGFPRRAAQRGSVEQILAQLLATRSSVLRRALESAIKSNIIPLSVQTMLDAVMERLEELRRELGLPDESPVVAHEVIGQLLNKETGAPLPSFTVRAFDLDAGTQPKALAPGITDNRGLFSLDYTTPGGTLPGDGLESDRKLRLHIFDSRRTEIYRTDVAVPADQQQVLQIQVPATPVPEAPTPEVTELAVASQLELPQELLAFLGDKSIHRLADIRRAGGIGHIEALPVRADHPAVRALEAHASLSLVSEDITLNAKLIENGLTSVLALANAPRTRVVAMARDTLGDFRAARMHVMAQAQKSYLDNHTTARMAESANGFFDEKKPQPGFEDNYTIFPRKCGCEDCASAVSPLAYLADLLDYAVGHVQKTGGAAVSLSTLTNTFFQPFGRLPASCEEMDKKVRQVRLCIEVLRRYLKAKDLPATNSKAQMLNSEEWHYRLAAYQLMLSKLGTSYEEVRLARTAPAEKRKALAGRLGIELGAGTPDHLDTLFLDPATPTNPIPEADLEKLFGLVDTDKTDPLAPVPTPKFLAWRLDYLRALWQEQDRPTDQYAEDFASVVEFSEERLPIIDPDVVGPDDFRYPFAKSDSNGPDQVFDIWLRRRMWVDGRIAALAGLNKTAVHKAELKDLPQPIAFPASLQAKISFDSPGQFLVFTGVMSGDEEDLLLALSQEPSYQAAVKKLFENSQLAPFKVPNLAGILSSMIEEVSYEVTPFTPWVNRPDPVDEDFDFILEKLSKGTEPEVEAAKSQIRADLGLTAESFTRLVGLRDKARRAESDPKNEPVKEEEWVEIYSILVQAQKVRLFAAWIAEEVEQAHLFGPTDFFGPSEFWIPLREPREGDWPPAVPGGQPLIDPEVVKLDELPDPTAGKRARELWEARRLKLEETRDKLKGMREAQANVTAGFEVLLTASLGNSLPDLDKLNKNLADPALEIVVAAKETIQNDLHMTLEAFTHLMTIKAKNKPSDDEWAEVYAILTSARKIRTDYEQWLVEENDPTEGVKYWSALKAKVPRWRASSEARQKWLQALRTRSRAPLIDPDLMIKDDLKMPATGPASALWTARKKEIEAHLVAFAAQPRTAGGLKALVLQAVGVEADELKALDEVRQAGEDIEPRLEQLSLTTDAFAYLLRILTLAEAPQPVLLHSEWDEVYAILVQVQKRRTFARWRQEEKKQGLTLGPDHFQFPEVDFTTFPPPPPLELRAWRADWTARRDWQDTLQARIDQEQAVIDALAEAVSAVEEATLPRLRDALVMSTDAKGTRLDQKAKWITDRLLIDAQASGCQVTTRIAQAIETIQGILFSLRTAQLQDTHPLELEAEHFDEEWEWIGSYATWRAAMFVFLYPENILLPSLRRWQTPAFRTLVRDLRSNRRLSPEQARAAARAYSEYFEDVAKLKLEASCETRTRVHYKDGNTQQEIDRCLFYMFGRGATTNTVYWSAYDAQDASGYAQTFWEAVPGLDKVVTVLGATPYEISAEERFIYLFAITLEKATKKLVFTKYDLEKQSWDDEPTELELPEEATDFTAVVKQTYEEKNPPHLGIRVSQNGRIYLRELGPDGAAWADGEWKPLFGPLKCAIYKDLLAMVEIAPGEFYVLVARYNNLIEYRLLGDRDDGGWNTAFAGSFVGALAWPGSFDLYIFYTMGSSLTLSYGVVNCSSSDFPDLDVYGIGGLDSWLVRVPGVSLGQLNVPENSPFSPMTLLDFFQLPPPQTPEELQFWPWLAVASNHFTQIGAIYLNILKIGEALLNRAKLECIEWLAGQIEGASDYVDERGDGFGKWKLADDMLGQFNTMGYNTEEASILREALKRIVPIHYEPIIEKRDLDVDGDEEDVIVGAEWTPVSPGYTGYRVRRGDNKEILGSLAPNLFGRGRIIPTSGLGGKSSMRRIAYQQTAGPTGGYHCSIERTGDMLTPVSPVRVAPSVVGPFEITEQLTPSEIQTRKVLSQQNFDVNAGGPHSNLAYLEEATYFVPIHLALQLQQRGQYTAALDWFRTVYDYSMPVKEGDEEPRKIYYGLIKEATGSTASQYERSEADWLLDPLNPHLIAEQRRKTYTRFTLLSLVRCFLDFADAEFTRDTAESVPRARTLYMTALELLETADLKQSLGLCTDVIGELEIEVGDAPWEVGVAVLDGLKKDLNRINDYHVLEETIGAVKAVLGGPGDPDTWEARTEQAHGIIAQAVAQTPGPPLLAAVVEGKAGRLAQAHAALLVQPEIVLATRRAGEAAATEFQNSVSLVTGQGLRALAAKSTELPWLRTKMPAGIAMNGRASGQPISMSFGAGEAMDRSIRQSNPLALTRTGSLARVAHDNPALAVTALNRYLGILMSAPSFEFCIPANPIIKALRLRAELNLYKLRNCRNIAGMERELDPYAAPTDTTSGLPMIGAGGQLVLPGLIKFAPTSYRYPVLIERAKHLVGLAQQIEAAFLSALEKGDAERYSVLKARQDMSLTRAGVRLQDLRVKEAEGGVKLAELQQERAQIQVQAYKEWIEAGPNDWEQKMLGAYQDTAQAQMNMAVAEAAGQAAMAATTAATAGLGAAAAAGSAAVAAVAAMVRAEAMRSVAQSQANAYIYAFQANHERRADEWQLQKNLAEQDVRIGAQGIKIAQDHVRVVGQERVIAEMQAEHAEAVVEFLANKFTNLELYDWMSDVLEGVYSFFLQQATSMAQLAAGQLAFERQEVPPPYIQADYWEAPSDGDTGGNVDGKAPDRRGLTGSARLLQDIYQLDQYAFDTDKRKLQLTKTISLAAMAPTEFQRFRETGVLLFATPMEMFDRDFPGHYLRLIKRVKTSVVALIPPTQGIRATLSTTGRSRAVIGGDVFQKVVANNGPQVVALSSPRDATGLFELDQQAEMLLPFEGMGVDTNWELRMPKAANLFDYRTIADVLITIEYTALHSFDYYQQVVQTLNPRVSANRPFSFRHQFADQWYDLHNPDQTATPMTVRFQTGREDFPPNLERLKISQIALYFARASGKTFEVPVSYLRFTEQDGAGPVGGGSTSVEGVISTLKGNAGSWTAMLDKAPIGEWELSLPGTMEMKQRFKNEEIENILFVITYSGRTPGWPNW